MVAWVKPLERRSRAFSRASSSSNWNGNQDRKGLAAAAQLADQVQPADARQAEVDDGKVMIEFVGLIQRFFGIGHGIDDMPAFTEPRLQVVTQQRLVFHHQHFHVLCSQCKKRPGSSRPSFDILSAKRHQK